MNALEILFRPNSNEASRLFSTIASLFVVNTRRDPVFQSERDARKRVGVFRSTEDKCSGTSQILDDVFYEIAEVLFTSCARKNRASTLATKF